MISVMNAEYRIRMRLVSRVVNLMMVMIVRIVMIDNVDDLDTD